MFIFNEYVGFYKTIIQHKVDYVECTRIKINLSFMTILLIVDNVLLKRGRNIGYNYTCIRGKLYFNFNLKLGHINNVILYLLLFDH